MYLSGHWRIVNMAVLIINLTFSELALSLLIRSSPGKGTKNCKEALTARYPDFYVACPSVGSFPLAGACDRFIHCIPTEEGVESQAVFCPSGENYSVNKCVPSNNAHDCPQKHCPINEIPNTLTSEISKRKPVKPHKHDASHTTSRSPHSTGIPFLNNLHPSKNGAKPSDSKVHSIGICLFTISRILIMV